MRVLCSDLCSFVSTNYSVDLVCNVLSSCSAECDHIIIITPLRTINSSTLFLDYCMIFKSNNNRCDCCSVSGIAIEVATVTQTKLRYFKRHPAIKPVEPVFPSDVNWFSNTKINWPTGPSRKAKQVNLTDSLLLIVLLNYFGSQTVVARTIDVTSILINRSPIRTSPKERSAVNELVLLNEQERNSFIIASKDSVLIMSRQMVNRLELSNWVLKKQPDLRSYNVIFSSYNITIEPTAKKEFRANYLLPTNCSILLITTNYLLNYLWSVFSILWTVKLIRSLRLEVVFAGIDKIGIINLNYRNDILCSEDVAEEFLRVLTFYYLPKQLVHYNKTATNDCWRGCMTDERKKIRDIRKLLVSRGYSEIISSSIVFSPNKVARTDGVISLSNSIAKRTDVLRDHIITSWTNAILPHTKRLTSCHKLFEVGNSYFGRQSIVYDTQTLQHQVLAVLSCNKSYTSSWRDHTGSINSHCLRFDLESVFQVFDKTYCTKTVDHPLLNPVTSTAIITNGKMVGYIGELCKTFININNLTPPLIAFELLLDGLTNNVTIDSNLTVSHVPSTVRDISFVCWTGIKPQVLIDSVYAVTRKGIRRCINAIKLFDIYQRQRELTLGLRVSFARLYRSGTINKTMMIIVNHSVRTSKLRLGIT